MTHMLEEDILAYGSWDAPPFAQTSPPITYYHSTRIVTRAVYGNTCYVRNWGRNGHASAGSLYLRPPRARKSV